MKVHDSSHVPEGVSRRLVNAFKTAPPTILWVDSVLGVERMVTHYGECMGSAPPNRARTATFPRGWGVECPNCRWMHWPQPLDHHAKFILMSPGLDRCVTVGFRCVKDVRSR